MVASAKFQVLTNLGFAFIKAISLIISLRLADAMLSAQVLGLVLLFRRQATLWANFVQLGLSQSIKRYYLLQSTKAVRDYTWFYQVRIGIASAAFFCFLGVTFPEVVSTNLLGITDRSVGVALTLLTIGISIGYFSTSSWLAEFRFAHANLIEWLNGSLIFIFCLSLTPLVSDNVFVLALATLTLISSIVFLWHFRGQFIESVKYTEKPPQIDGSVISYSISRCLTAFCEIGVFVIGPWMLRDELAQSGHLILAYTFLKVAQMVVNPVAKVFAIRAGSFRLNRESEERNVVYFSLFSFAFSWLMVGGYLILGEGLLSLWLPQSGPEVADILKTLIYFVPAVSLFYCLRSHIEIRYRFPWNLVTLLTGLAVFLYLSFDLVADLDKVIHGTVGMLSVFYIYGIIYFSVIFISQSSSDQHIQKQ